jgi:hypothetical protein
MSLELGMAITFRDAVTALHGMGLGALLLLLFSGAAFGLYATLVSDRPWTQADGSRVLPAYLAVMAALAWAAVLAGAYVVYPWYRAHPPAGLTDLTAFPRSLLLSNPATAGWHDIGMEWKEHVAWFAPISLTVAAAIVARYGAGLRTMKPLRDAVIGLVLLAFFSTCVAGFFGAMLNKFAPVRGGSTLVLMTSHD